MKRFSYFAHRDLLLEAKVDDFINRYTNYHKDLPIIENNPDLAKQLIGHAHKFAQGHDESIFLTRQLLDGVYKPGEDDPTIQATLGKWRKAKTSGLVGGKLSDHTHESISAVFEDIPQLNLQKRQTVALQGMEKYKIGSINHPTHGTLDVYNIRKKNIQDDTEYQNISSSLRKTCSGYSWCVLPQENGPVHLKHYSHGPGIFFYVNNQGTPVLSHGFGDRGIVRPNNRVISNDESKDIITKTSSLLKDDHKEVYEFFNTGKKDFDFNKQNAMYDEFGHIHGAAHFLDPRVNTHPKLINRILDDVLDQRFNYRGTELAENLAKHPNFNSSHISTVIKKLNQSYPTTSSLGTGTTTLLQKSFDSKNLKPEHIDEAIQSKNNFIVTAGIKSYLAKPKHIKWILANHPDPSVRIDAAKQFHKMTDEASTIAINDKSVPVFSLALMRQELKPHHYEQALDRITNNLSNLKNDSIEISKLENELDNHYKNYDIRLNQEEYLKRRRVIDKTADDVKSKRAKHTIDYSDTHDMLSSFLDNVSRNKSIDPKLLHKMIDTKMPRVLKTVIDHPNVDSDHAQRISDLLNNKDFEDPFYMGQPGHYHRDIEYLQDNVKFLTKNHPVEPLVAPSDSSESQKNLVFAWQDDLHNFIEDNKNKFNFLAKNKNLKSEDYDQLIGNINDTNTKLFIPHGVGTYDRPYKSKAIIEDAYQNLLNNPTLKTHHVEKILDASKPKLINVRGAQKFTTNIPKVYHDALSHPKLSSKKYNESFDQHLSDLLNGTGIFYNSSEKTETHFNGFVNSPHFNVNHINKILASRINENSKSFANLDPMQKQGEIQSLRHKLKGIKDTAYLHGMQNNLLNDSHHEYALKLPEISYPDYNNPEKPFISPDATAFFSAAHAVKHGASPYISELIQNHPNKQIRSFFPFLNRKLSSQQLHDELKKAPSDVIGTALQHPNIKREHMERVADEHPDHDVAKMAKMRLRDMDISEEQNQEKVPVKESIYFSVRRILLS